MSIYTPGADPIGNDEDVIDSRDVIARIEHLENQGVDELDEYEQSELLALRELAQEGSAYLADWDHGESLIRDSYFQTYAEELAEEVGAISSENQWPLTYIDWERAADALKQDYSEIDFDGVTYWARA